MLSEITVVEASPASTTKDVSPGADDPATDEAVASSSVIGFIPVASCSKTDEAVTARPFNGSSIGFVG